MIVVKKDGLDRIIFKDIYVLLGWKFFFIKLILFI